MHQTRDIERRIDRVKRLQNEEEHSNAVFYYTDASYSTEHCTIAIWSRNKTLTCKYQRAPTPMHAELLAIATAITELMKYRKNP